MTSSRRLRVLSLVTTLAVAAPGVIAPTPSRAAIPGPGVVLSVIRLARNRLVEKPRAYRDVARNRDADLRVAAAQLRTVETYRSAGLMPDDLYRQQQQRYADLRAGIKERAQREVKISKDAYDRAFGAELRGAALNALTSSLGVDTKAGRFVSQIGQGKDPLSAALSLIPDPKLSPVGQRINELSARYGELRDRLQEARTALAYVRDPSKIPLQQELTRLLDRATSIAADRATAPPSDLERRMEQVSQGAAALRQANAELRNAVALLRPESPSVNRTRFQNDSKWRELSAAVNLAGAELGNAPRVAVAAVNRANEQYVKDLLAGTGLKLNAAELSRVLLAADVAWLRSARDARTQGLDPNSLDRQAILRAAMDAQLVKMQRAVTTIAAATRPPAATTVAPVTMPVTKAPPTSARPTVPATTRPATTAPKPTVAVTTTRRATTTPPTTAVEQWVAWFATKIGFNPMYVTTKAKFDLAEKSCNYPGGGMDCSIPMEKTFAIGPYATQKEAMTAICSSLSNFSTMSGIYAGMRMAVFQGQRHNIDNLACP